MSRKNDLVIVANRLPVRRGRKQGREVWDTSPGGLVSALLPILRREGQTGRGGAWVGWAGSRTRTFEPFEHEGVWNLPVNLNSAHVDDYYDGMSNATLWPLYHDAVRPPSYQRRWWRAYREVNSLFAQAAASIAADGATVWVHDYHLHLVPGMLRDLRPDLRIGYFLHIPFPGSKLFAQLPNRRDVVQGTLGADVIGFQTRDDAEGFIDTASRFADVRARDDGVVYQGRKIVVDAFPISIDARQINELARSDEMIGRAARDRRRLGGRKIFLGVDRMDYTKGIDIRLRAFRELLRTGQADSEEVVLVQSCVPTRERVGTYADLKSEIEKLVGEINGDYGAVGRASVHYLRQNLAPEDLVSLYLAADVALVTPVRDGMNLIAKEYVAARHDERGVLVLSEFTGAVHELTEALIVNPHDLDSTVAAMVRAIRMPPEEESRRMRSLRTVVFERDVYHWADKFLDRLMGSMDPAVPTLPPSPEPKMRKPEPVGSSSRASLPTGS